MIKLALIYDFDQTLCNKNMQEYSLLPQLNIDPSLFWQEVGELSQNSNMDSILAYMYLLVKHAKKNGKYLTRDLFFNNGKDIEFYPGVEEYFEMINQYAQSKGVQLKHYIISSGTQEIIEGSKIYQYFDKVFACEFHYDENGNADWPALAINYTGKTQFLFRINKNCLDVYDNTTINLGSTKRDIPFNHMIYIADGFTDVPCMSLVKNNGGHSIAVHNGKAETYKQLLKDNRVNYVAQADYRDDSELVNVIKAIIDKTVAEEKLAKFQL